MKRESNGGATLLAFVRAIDPKELLLVIILVAACLRIYGLDHASFWWDEGSSAGIAENPHWSVWADDVHPPLYYWALTVWSQISGTDFWLRLLSVVFGVTTIAVVYSLGKRLFSERAGIASAAALGVMSFHIYHSQQARMYTLLTLLFACALWGLVVATRERRPIGWYVYVASCTGLAYCHGIGVLYAAVIASLFPFCIESFRVDANWKRWILCNVVIALFFARWLSVWLTQATGVVENFWVQTPGWRAPLRVLMELVVRPHPKVAPFLLWILNISIVGTVASATIAARPEKRWVIRVMIAAAVLPLLIVFLISRMFTPIFIPRLFLPLSVPLAILIGSALSVQDRYRRVAAGACAAAIVGMTLATIYQLQHPEDHEPWRVVSAFLQKNAARPDVIVYNSDDWYGQYLVRRYDKPHALAQNDQLVLSKQAAGCAPSRTDECLDALLLPYTSGTTFWIINSHMDPRMAGAVHSWVSRHFADPVDYAFDRVTIDRLTLVH